MKLKPLAAVAAAAEASAIAFCPASVSAATAVSHSSPFPPEASHLRSAPVVQATGINLLMVGVSTWVSFLY